MNKREFKPDRSGMMPCVKPTPCPNCGGKMHHAALRTSGIADSHIFVEDEAYERDDRYKVLDVWVFYKCGYIELHTLPSKDYCQKQT